MRPFRAGLLGLVARRAAQNTSLWVWLACCIAIGYIVLTAARRPRVSMPLFLHPRAEVRLSARHTAGSYLEERLRELGLK